MRRHAPFERPQLNSLGWASKGERNRAEPTALATIVQLLRSPNSPGPAPALSRSLGLQSSRRLQRCFAQQQQQQDVDDPASQHASSTASMLLSIAERRAAEPRCMGAVIQPTVLLWLYGYRPAHSVSWLVPIFQVSRPSGVLGHASSVMTGYRGVKATLQRCAAASRTRLQPISQPNLPCPEAHVMLSQRHIPSGRSHTRALMAPMAAAAGAGAGTVRRTRQTAEKTRRWAAWRPYARSRSRPGPAHSTAA